jgi:hypothetical protein
VCVHKLLDGKLKSGVRLAIHDLPGLNDSKTSNVYHPYVIENFHRYDIILFVVDVISALNTSDEKSILNLILRGIIDNKEKHDTETELMVIINKCDEMEIIDNNSHEARPINDEYKSMVDQVRNIITDTANTMRMSNPIRFVCLSAEDAYIYRMYQRDSLCLIDAKHRNKFGVNEFGKNQWNKMNEKQKNDAFNKCMTRENIAGATELAGFTYFDWKLGNILTHEKQFIYLINHLIYEVKMIKMNALKPGDQIDKQLEEFAVVREKLVILCSKYGKNFNECKFFQDKFTAFMSEFFAVNANFLIPLKPTHEDLPTYTVSDSLKGILGTIISKFKSWMNPEHGDKYLIVKENIDKYLHQVIVSHSTPYDEIVINLEKFNDPVMRGNAITYLCSNMCSYDFIMRLRTTEDREIANKIGKTIEQLNPDCTAIQWCDYICKNILIATNWVKKFGQTQCVDSFEIMQVFNGYHIHSKLRTAQICVDIEITKNVNIHSLNECNIKQRLNDVKKWALKNAEIQNGFQFPAILLDFCLNKLSKNYPNHVVNLDEFYGVSREFVNTEVDIFYALHADSECDP